MGRKATGVPKVLSRERVLHFVSAAIPSRTERDRIYQPSIALEATMLCSCAGNAMRDSICAHLKAMVDDMDADELRAWVLSAQVIPEEISADVDEPNAH